MRALFSIVKLTLRSALRSHIFQLLLFFLVLCIAFVPTTVGGGTAMDFIRVSLLYSLSGVGMILSLSALWVGCHVMSADVDSYRLHMVVSKPVSRVTVWFGKWLGVTILHLVLLAIAAAAICGVVLWRFHNGDFPAEERARIAQEVLVGRRVFLPERPDYAKLAEKAMKEKIRQRIADGAKLDLSEKAQERMYKDCLAEAVAKDSETFPDKPREWIYKDVPRNVSRLLYLRYRPYVTKVRSEDQRDTALRWYVYAPVQRAAKPAADAAADPDDGQGGEVPRYPHYLTLLPQRVMAGEFHEIRLPGDREIVSPKGEVRIGVENWDPKRDKHYYQPNDGPKLLVEVTGFVGNYSRAVLVLALQLFTMTLLSCALGGFLTLPTAVFVSMSYLVFGFISSFMTDTEYYVNGWMDKVGQWISWKVLSVVVPLTRFDVTDLVAGGELVEWSLIWDISWSCLLLRMLPVAALGIYLYWRREIGLEIKK